MSVTNPQITLWAGDTFPSFQFRITTPDGTGAQDLTGALAQITITPVGTTAVPIVKDAGIVFDPPGGGVTYTFARPLTLPPGVQQALYQAQWTFTFPSGQVLHSDTFGILVQRPLDG